VRRSGAHAADRTLPQGGCLGRESSPNSNRVESHPSAEQSNLPRARRILKFVFALGYLVVRRHEPRMYMGLSWPGGPPTRTYAFLPLEINLDEDRRPGRAGDSSVRH
jgi:hypothetical protein